MGQVIAAILLWLSNLCAKNQRGNGMGQIFRAMSCVLVNVLNAISPPTCRRQARSMATAPPSDQPPALIREGGNPRDTRAWDAAPAVARQPTSDAEPPLKPYPRHSGIRTFKPRRR